MLHGYACRTFAPAPDAARCTSSRSGYSSFAFLDPIRPIRRADLTSLSVVVGPTLRRAHSALSNFHVRHFRRPGSPIPSPTSSASPRRRPPSADETRRKRILRLTRPSSRPRSRSLDGRKRVVRREAGERGRERDRRRGEERQASWRRGRVVSGVCARKRRSRERPAVQTTACESSRGGAGAGGNG